jgi:transposase InsO family protein
MPWTEVTAMQEKERFLELAQTPGVNISQLCREFGISRKTGYRILNQEEGSQGIKERSRRPKHSPNKTSIEIEELIVSTRRLYPSWGGEKLKKYLATKGYSNLPTVEESEKRKPWIRFEHENPNDLWQMDFKGHFATDQERCHPLTLLDDHSRYSLEIKACENQQMNTVKNHLIDVFRTYGLPSRMTMDNGSPWGYSGDQMHTQLTAWLIQLGIYVSHSRPNHPQTQGKLERFHRTLKLELLSQYQFNNLREAQEGFNWWRNRYNNERPHASLNLEVPAMRYKRSERNYPEILPVFEYEKDILVRKVQQGGFIYLHGKIYKVGYAFYGHKIGIKESEEEGVMEVYFYHQKVNKIDLRYPYK